MVSPDGQVCVVDEQVSHHRDARAVHEAGVLEGRRVVWWSASSARALIGDGRLSRVWDIAAVHRLIAGGHRDDPVAVWSTRFGLPIPAPIEERQARPGGPDLFAGLADEDTTLSPGQPLPARTGSPEWLRDGGNRELWGRAALDTALWQADVLDDRCGGLSCATSESGAAMLCVELEEHGLPIDRPTLEGLIAQAAGPRPTDDRHAAEIRRGRDAVVWQHLPGGGSIDLRNPLAVRDMLRRSGINVQDTRAWHLEPYRAGSPLVDALLDWRKAERIATTYGWHWLDRFVGPDDRLRGEWDASDGGAGRMTAGSGLHSLPAPLRPGVAAAAGHVLVRADLGQIEPRVLAVVSRDPALAEATRADDLYAEIATDLSVDRPTAKIAMLAAMYGQTSGTAGQVLGRLEHTYPVAMAYLRDAALRGERGESVMTYGGRLVPVSVGPDDTSARARGRGRFTRNAVVQGAAAEFFKAWALTVRAAIAPLGGEIVLCLHDELLVHTPAAQADSTMQAVETALQDAARRWSGGAPVRFVADAGIFHRWSEAKD